MPSWKTIEQHAAMPVFWELGRKIRSKEIDLGRENYALGLAHGVLQAIHCGYERISAVELGVAGGHGFLDLCKAAEYLRGEFDIEIDVYGFDNATGLGAGHDYRDHPEIWFKGQFQMPDPAILRAQMPGFAELIIGDVEDTLGDFERSALVSPLGFVAIDVDYYSSTRSAMKIFSMKRECYVPAVPVYVDDVEVLISYNSWCGEALAIREFNERNDLRKIEPKMHYGIHNFHVCHVLDHPIRTGEIRPRFPFEIRSF